MPSKKPPSPFVLMVFGLAMTTVAAEWMRFQFGTTLLLPVAAFGTAVTLRTTVSAYRARRAWRLHRESARTEPAGVNASARVGATRFQEPAWSERVVRRDAPTSASSNPSADTPLGFPREQRSVLMHERDTVNAFDADTPISSRRTR